MVNQSRVRKWASNWIFLLTVVTPTALAIVYYALVASDVYISESRFVVRNPQRQTQSGLGALLQSTGFTRSQDDTYSVHDYVMSRDALTELERQLSIRKAYTRLDTDIFNRPARIALDASFEATTASMCVSTTTPRRRSRYCRYGRSRLTMRATSTSCCCRWARSWSTI